MIFTEFGRRIVRTILAATVLALPAAIYLLLAIYAPSQYPFVVLQATGRGWPLVYAVAVLVAYALCAFWLLRSHDILNPALGVFASATTLAALLSSFYFAGPAPANIAASIAAAIVLVGGYVLLRRPGFRAKLHPFVRSTWFGPVIAMAIYFTFGLASGFEPVVFPREIGSFAIFAVFAGALAVVTCALALHPWIFAAATVYCICAVMFFCANDHVIPTAQNKSSTTPIPTAFLTWLTSRHDLDAYRSRQRPYPVILVSSEGGGIYAAAHAYGVLSTLANHCPTFSQHVFAVVGVSGGAIGNALFASATDPMQKTHAPCGPSASTVDPAPITTDHLSPPLARLLLVEPVDRLLPGQWMRRDRAQILADSFLSVATSASYLETAISDTFDPKSARPAVLSVAVNVANGRRLVIAPFRQEEFAGTAQWWPGGNPYSDQPHQGPEVSVLNGAGVSARFPWITPTGRLRISEDEELTLADGGYFDNSGADTVLDLIANLRVGDNWRQFDSGDVEAIDAEEMEADFPECLQFVMIKNFHEPAIWSKCKWPIFIVYLALASQEPVASLDVAESEPAADLEALPWAPGGKSDGEQAQSQPNKRDLQERTDLNLNQSFVFDPIRALLATRESRAEIALARADLELCGTRISGAECYFYPGSSLGFFRNDIAPRAWNLPLGWYMPRAGLDMMLAKTVPASIFEYRTQKDAAETDIEMVLFHLDPDLYKEGADPDIGDVIPDP